jgi:hypothetical protein
MKLHSPFLVAVGICWAFAPGCKPPEPKQSEQSNALLTLEYSFQGGPHIVGFGTNCKMELAPSQDCFFQDLNIDITNECASLTFDPASISVTYTWLDGTKYNAMPLLQKDYPGRLKSVVLGPSAKVSGRIIIQLPTLPVEAGPARGVEVNYGGPKSERCEVRYRPR